MRFIRCQKGLSLIELIVAVSILVLIIAAGISLYDFGTSTYASGEEKARIQRNVRLAETLLVDQLRNANDILLVPTASSLPAGYNKGLQLSSNTLMNLQISSSSKPLAIIELISDAAITVQSISGKPVLRYSLAGNGGHQTYSLSGTIRLNNLPVDSLSGKVVLDQSYSLKEYLIYYNKP